MVKLGTEAVAIFTPFLCALLLLENGYFAKKQIKTEMKKTLLLILLSLAFIACNSLDKEAEKAIQKYMDKNIDAEVRCKSEFYSKLFIIDPKNDDKLPKIEGDDIGDKFIAYMALYGAGVDLAISGCTPSTMKKIIKNDDYFRKWNTGGNEYVMIGFFKVTNILGEESRGGLCFKLDSTLTVTRAYTIEDKEEIFCLVE